jgi:drug/metabolite transporter (DMT)-like permease
MTAITTRACSLALCGFALMNCGDAVIKSIAGAWSPLAVAALRYSIGAVTLGCWVYHREGLSGFRTRMPRLQLLRGMSMSLCTITYYCAIFVMPLADAAAISFVGPMLTVLLAGIVLHERVKPRTYLVIITSFAGVVLVLRPNLLALGPVALLPLFCAAMNSTYMIGNRLTIGDGSIIAQQFFVAAISSPLLIVATLVGHFSGLPGFALTLPAWHVVARCALVAGSATAAHWLVFRATMLVGPGTIAPTIYVQILVATVIGWSFFDNQPSLSTLAGIAVIVASGLYLWFTSRVPPPEPLD